MASTKSFKSCGISICLIKKWSEYLQQIDKKKCCPKSLRYHFFQSLRLGSCYLLYIQHLLTNKIFMIATKNHYAAFFFRLYAASLSAFLSILACACLISSSVGFINVTLPVSLCRKHLLFYRMTGHNSALISIKLFF